jgi:hypothetical protein
MIIIHGMLLIVIIIGPLSLSWSHVVLSFGLMRVLKHRITFIPKVLYFLGYGALLQRMVLVFTWGVLEILDVDFCLVGLYVGHQLPIDFLGVFARTWRLILILRFLCRKRTLGLLHLHGSSMMISLNFLKVLVKELLTFLYGLATLSCLIKR